jgi:hypothetical protein
MGDDTAKSKKHVHKIITENFLKGFFSGIGTIAGTTLGVGLALFLISKLQLVPIIGTFVKDIVVFVQQNLTKH